MVAVFDGQLMKGISMQQYFRGALAGLVLVLTGAQAFAQEEPEAGSLMLSDILATIENSGERLIYSADFHIRNWEIVSCPDRSRRCREDTINPADGQVRRTDTELVGLLPPEGAMPLSEIVRQVEAMNVGRISSVEFDDRRWEVETRAGLGRRAELRIEPMSGAVWRCEGRACP